MRHICHVRCHDLVDDLGLNCCIFYLNKRFHPAVEIKNATVKAQIVNQIMAANMADVAQSWIMSPDGTFKR
ncbi:MAG: hypothetical protein AAFQ04_07765, partial [Pseudomonadota bacterium]